MWETSSLLILNTYRTRKLILKFKNLLKMNLIWVKYPEISFFWWTLGYDLGFSIPKYMGGKSTDNINSCLIFKILKYISLQIFVGFRFTFIFSKLHTCTNLLTTANDYDKNSHTHAYFVPNMSCLDVKSLLSCIWYRRQCLKLICEYTIFFSQTMVLYKSWY